MITPDFPDVTQLAVPFFLAAMLAEIAYIKFWKAKGQFETKDTLTSLIMGAGSVVSGMVFGFIAYGFAIWVWQFRLFDLGLSIWVGLIAFVLDDLRYYWYHRFAHTIRWVWAEHINHHSSQHYNLSTALRQSWTGVFTGKFVLLTPLVLLGVHPAFLVFIYGFNLVYQFWIHTEAIDKMPGWFEIVMNTPSHHRVHHATNPRYLDANYAGTLIVWDKMFGTFVPELKAEHPRYGIVKNIATFNPLKVAFHEWIAMFSDFTAPGLGFSERLQYLWRPPGWSHDGSRKSSKQLKAEFVERNNDAAGMPGLPELVDLSRQPGE